MAQYGLGNMYRQGLGVTQDDREAIRWYRLSAVQGNADAQFNLGAMYDNGRGVVKDHVRGNMWLNLAADKGNGDAKKYRDALVRTMTPAQVAEAQKLARECEKRNYRNCD
jgi:hypothetical protein